MHVRVRLQVVHMAQRFSNPCYLTVVREHNVAQSAERIYQAYQIRAFVYVGAGVWPTL